MTHTDAQARFSEIQKNFNHYTGGGLLVLDFVPLDKDPSCKISSKWRKFRAEWQISTVEMHSTIIGRGATPDECIEDAENWIKNRF